MTFVKTLIWNSWNLAHITKHHVTQKEIEEVCLGSHTIIQSYRQRILVSGETKKGKYLEIVLSPYDAQDKPYKEGVYYLITAYEKETYEK